MEKLKQNIQKSASGESPLGYDPTGADQAHLSWIDPEKIDLDPNQPRKDPGDLSELAASIAEHGIIMPLVVERTENRRFRLIAGERRYRAAKQLELKEVPCVVRTIEEHKKLGFQLVENLHRKDLNPIEEAQSYERLMAEFNYDQPSLAKYLGKSKASINETLRVLHLPDSIREEIAQSSAESISKSILLEIAKHEDQELQSDLWKKLKDGALTVRKAREAKKPVPKGQQAQGDQQTKSLKKQAYHTKQKVTVVIQNQEGEDLSWDKIIGGLEEALAYAKQAKADGKQTPQ